MIRRLLAALILLCASPALATVAYGPYYGTVAKRSPIIGWWRMNESSGTLTGLSGYGGTNMGATGTCVYDQGSRVAGTTDTSVFFDGSSCRFATSGATDDAYWNLAANNTGATITAWVYPSSTKDQTLIANQQGSGTNPNWELRMTASGKFLFNIYNTADGVYQTTGEVGSYTHNTINYFVAVIVDWSTSPHTLTLIVNGSTLFSGQPSTTGSYASTDGQLKFGAVNVSGVQSRYFHGLIDEVALWMPYGGSFDSGGSRLTVADVAKLRSVGQSGTVTTGDLESAMLAHDPRIFFMFEETNPTNATHAVERALGIPGQTASHNGGYLGTGGTNYGMSGTWNTGTVPTTVTGFTGKAVNATSSGGADYRGVALCRHGEWQNDCNATWFAPHAADWSLEVWIKRDTSGSGAVATKAWYEGSCVNGQFNWLLTAGDANVTMTFWRSDQCGGAHATLQAGLCPAGQWCQIVVAYDWGVTAKLYVNGSLVDTETVFSGPVNSTATAIAVGVAYQRQAPFEGLIDNLAFYQFELSSAQVTDHYTKGTEAVAAMVGRQKGWGFISMLDDWFLRRAEAFPSMP